MRIGAVLEPSLNLLSHFHAREKQSILVVAPFQFLGRKKKWSTGPLLAFLIFMLVKKQSILVVAPFQFLGRKKKWSTGPFF
ncbi:TPA: hypothetical protein ACGOW0_001328 [Streptococcus suis]